MLKRIHLVVDDEQDTDILTWLARQSNKSAAIRRAIRRTMQEVTVDDLATQMAEVTARLETMQATVEDWVGRGSAMAPAAGGKAGAESVEDALPADVLANLEALGW